jgi:hypothetical protein
MGSGKEKEAVQKCFLCGRSLKREDRVKLGPYKDAIVYKHFGNPPKVECICVPFHWSGRTE